MRSILILSLIFLFSCSNVKREVGICSAHSEKVNIEPFVPIETGNSWSYEISYEEEWLNSLSKEEKIDLEYELTIEIGETTTIYNKTNHEREPIEAYKLITNGRENIYHFFVKCNDQIQFVEVNDWENLTIVATQPIYHVVKDTSTNWTGMAIARHDWKSSRGRAARGVRNDCETVEEFMEIPSLLKNANKKVDASVFWWLGSRSTFCRGKGLTRKEYYDEEGNKTRTLDLVDYDLVTKD